MIYCCVCVLVHERVSDQSAGGRIQKRGGNWLGWVREAWAFASESQREWQAWGQAHSGWGRERTWVGLGNDGKRKTALTKTGGGRSMNAKGAGVRHFGEGPGRGGEGDRGERGGGDGGRVEWPRTLGWPRTHAEDAPRHQGGLPPPSTSLHSLSSPVCLLYCFLAHTLQFL